MKYLNLFLVLAATVFLVDCGNNQPPTRTVAKKLASQDDPKAKNLSTMQLADLLATKYDSVRLNCKLWTRMKGPLVLADLSNSSTSLELIADSSFPKVINLTGKSETHSLSIQIKFNAIKIQDGTYTNNYGVQIHFRNSPVVLGTYSGKSETLYSSGYSSESFQGSDVILNENIDSQILASSSGLQGSPVPTVNYVECSLSTKAKSAYRDEWIQDAFGNPPSCLLGQPTNPSHCMISR